MMKVTHAVICFLDEEKFVYPFPNEKSAVNFYNEAAVKMFDEVWFCKINEVRIREIDEHDEPEGS